MIYEHFKEARPVIRRDIEELARDNTLIHSVLNSVHSGHCAFEQAMMEAVVLLAKHNLELENAVLKHVRISGPSNIKLETR